LKISKVSSLALPDLAEDARIVQSEKMVHILSSNWLRSYQVSEFSLLGGEKNIALFKEQELAKDQDIRCLTVSNVTKGSKLFNS
jgi:hypothetical protein